MRCHASSPLNPIAGPIALAAGISIFQLARLMGCSAAMIDRHYGHLARGSEDAIRARLEARTDRSGVEVASNSDAD